MRKIRLMSFKLLDCLLTRAENVETRWNQDRVIVWKGRLTAPPKQQSPGSEPEPE